MSADFQAQAQQFAEARLRDFLLVKQYASQLVQKGTLTAPNTTQLDALVSVACTLAALNLVLILLAPRGRKFIFDAVETVLAIALVAVLLAVVLGLPLGEPPRPRALCAWHLAACPQAHLDRRVACHTAAGIIYLVLKAVAYLLQVLTSLPAVSNLLTTLRSSVGL